MPRRIAATTTGAAAVLATVFVVLVSTGYGEPGFNVVEMTSDPTNLVFTEDFSDEDSLGRFAFSSPDHWQRVKVADRWAMEHAHAGAAYSPPHRSPHNIALIATQKFGRFVLDYDVQQTGREYGHRDACTFFSVVDPAHFYYAHVSTHSDPHAHQIFTVDDAPRKKITIAGTDGFDWGPSDSWHHVRLVRDPATGTILVYVDQMEEPIMRAADKTHGAGFIGFGSFDDTGRVTNIRVYSDQAENARPAFFRRK